MRVVAAEAVTEEDEETARRLMRHAKDARQGTMTLPLDYESDHRDDEDDE